jgi:hypothetical protein
MMYYFDHLYDKNGYVNEAQYQYVLTLQVLSANAHIRILYRRQRFASLRIRTTASSCMEISEGGGSAWRECDLNQQEESKLPPNLEGLGVSAAY